MALIICLHVLCHSVVGNNTTIPYAEKQLRALIHEEMSKCKNEGRVPSNDLFLIKAKLDVIDFFLELDRNSHLPTDKPCLEELPSNLLNDQKYLPFDRPSIQELEINLLYRNVVFWNAAQCVCDQDAAVQTYISMEWERNEEELAAESIRTFLLDNDWTGESLYIVGILSELPHRFVLPESGELLSASVTRMLQKIGTKEWTNNSIKILYTCLAVQLLGLHDDERSTQLLKTAFYEPHILLGNNSEDIDSSVLSRIRQHALLGYLYHSSDDALDFYRDALKDIALTLSGDHKYVVNMPPYSQEEVSGQSKATPGQGVQQEEWKAKTVPSRLYLTCCYCVDEMWRRKIGEPSKLPQILRFQRDRETIIQTGPLFQQCDFPLKPWSLYDIQGVLHEFPFGESQVPEKTQMKDGHFM